MLENKDIELLKNAVKSRLSQKRFDHTEGVVRAARFLSDRCCPEKNREAVIAAYLHDITKELSPEGQDELISVGKIALGREDIENPAIIHSFTAPVAIKRDFPKFATDEILSAVKNHTLGSPDMSVLDEIIFLADFIEEARVHEACISLREFVYSNMTSCDIAHNVLILHRACVMEIEATSAHLSASKKKINSKSILTRAALLGKINNK